MKKKIILLLLIVFSCFFATKNVYADICELLPDSSFYEITGVSLKEIHPALGVKDVKVGDKIEIVLKIEGNVDNISRYTLIFKNAASTDMSNYFLKDVKPVDSSNGNEYVGYFIVDKSFGVGNEWKYDSIHLEVNGKTLSPESTSNYCGQYLFDSNDSHIGAYGSYVENGFDKSFKILAEEDPGNTETPGAIEGKDGPDILKSFTLKSQSNKFYLGDKISFNVETTGNINTIAVFFYNTVSGTNYIYLTPDGNQDGPVRTYSGYIPKTGSGYYATAENGRTEMTIKPGSFEINSIFLYTSLGKNGYIRYTNNRDYANSGEFLYYDSKIKLDLMEPTADKLNDVNFVIDELKLNKNSAAIGDNVPMSFKYTYDNSNKKVKSIYLIFKNLSKNQTFTSYVKGLPNNPSFMIPSSADTSSYVLSSIGVNFEATDGTNNTVIFDGNTSSGKYKEIFSQELAVDASNGNEINGKISLSTEELSEEVFKRIQESDEKEVTIDADNETIIPLKLFNIIKESNKNLIIKYKGNELRFNGADIKSPKDLDVLMKLYNIGDSDISDNLKEALNGDAVVVEFPNNGGLPGNALFRVKETDLISKLNTNKYYIYYANTENDTLDKVALDVQKTSDGYIEFYINHHSKYVITTQEIKDEEVLGEDDAVLESNEELVVSKKTTTVGEEKKDSSKIILIIVLSAVILVLVVVFVILIVNRNKKKAKVEDKPIICEPLVEENTSEENKVEEENAPEETKAEESVPEEEKKEE